MSEILPGYFLRKFFLITVHADCFWTAISMLTALRLSGEVLGGLKQLR